MSFLFGAAVHTPADLQMEYRKSINRSIREYDREKVRMQMREKQLKPEIQRAAREGNLALLRTSAHELVRTRRQMQSLSATQFKMRTLGLKMQSMRSTHNLTGVLKNGIKAMNALNSTVNVGEMAKILQQFAQEVQSVDDKLDFMDEVMDDATGGGGEEDNEVDNVMGEVMAEIGIDLNDVLSRVPKNELVSSVAAPSSIVNEDEIEARLQRLREN